YKEVNKAYDAIHEAERGASKAAEAYSTAKKALKEARDAEAKAAQSASEKVAKESASDSAGTEARSVADEVDAAKGGGGEAAEAAAKCNSFPTGVQVLMADGSAKSIEDVKDGDVVMATDPQTGETRPKTVTTTITTPDDKDFTDLTLTDEASPRGPPAKLTSTYHHPYWSETRHQWTDAGELTTGEQLRQPDGTTLTVTATRTYPYAVTTHNLTVDDFHTYYVLAGATPVLVHNCNTTVYRVQTDHPDSQRLSVDGDGGVSINGDGMLHLNMSGNIAHTEQFRGSGGQIVAFDVPSSYVAQVRSAAIDQRRPPGMSRRQWNISSSGRPQIDDPGKGPDLYGIPSEMFSGLLGAIIPGSGRVL
ncbi:hypothetical protein J7E97_30615, partial [Streptomyces sp. ISL-66]|uniref:polymorphic toxin-type HINT domain-containing protein n=1 Tax=Streptomyces sp. ISL-66 TaxID=2819186 RepID=UPI001C19E766